MCNNNAKDDMIHDIASFWLPYPVIQAHKKYYTPCILSSRFGKQHNIYNLLCSILVSSQLNNV